MSACVVCAAGAQVGVLCATCAGRIASSPPRAPGIITARAPADSDACLVDEWGRVHPVGERCLLGRDPQRSELAIADLLVSHEHAELSREAGEWWVRDRGSANGTRIADGPRVRESRLARGEVLWLGTVGFYFCTERPPPAPTPRVKTLVPAQPSYVLVAPHGAVRVRAAAGHAVDRAPGELEFHPVKGKKVSRAALGRLQFQLLRRLCEAALSSRDGAVSASVGTHELLRALPFQSSAPEPNHVRQVVANLRAALARAGIPGGDSADDNGILVADEGLGYRLTWQVERSGGL